MALRRRLLLSYLVDWIVVVLFAIAGAVLTYISGFHRPFVLTDSAISFPLKSDIVSIPVAAAISLLGPAIVIGAINLVSVFIPHAYQNKKPLRNRVLAILWETHVGWLGLCASLAATLFVTAGLKDMVGKPRPHLLARCNPDVSNLSKFIVSGIGLNIESEAPLLVTDAICQQGDQHSLDDAFAAFPSGHSSFSSAGMVYLSLWLCARWGVVIPFPQSRDSDPMQDQRRSPPYVPRKGKSGPPLWQMVAALAPIVVALFICSSRYADFHHAGVDIVAGAVIGVVFAWASFRLYHRPLRSTASDGAWDPRMERHAFVAYSDHGKKRLDEEQDPESSNFELGRLDQNRPSEVDTGSSEGPFSNGVAGADTARRW